jgi:universal stress protein A
MLEPLLGDTAMESVWPPKRILVPIDFSELSGHGLRYAASLARDCGAELLVVHVGAFIPLLAAPGPEAGQIAALYYADSLLEQQRVAKEELTSRVAPLLGDVPVDTFYTEGDAALAVADLVEERSIDLVVVASHGRSGVSRALMGSVAERICRHASCAVTVVR